MSTDKAKGNHVELNDDGIIEVRTRGDQTVESVRDLGSDINGLIRQQRAKDQRALVLDDLRELGNVPFDARRLGADLIRSMDYERLAMCGSSAVRRLGVNLLLHATRRDKQVRYFDDCAEALAWLKAA